MRSMDAEKASRVYTHRGGRLLGHTYRQTGQNQFGINNRNSFLKAYLLRMSSRAILSEQWRYPQNQILIYRTTLMRALRCYFIAVSSHFYPPLSAHCLQSRSYRLL